MEIAGWAEAGARVCDAGLRRRARQEENISRPRGLRQPPRRHYSGPFSINSSSVADPGHFGVDPDLDPQIHAPD